MSSASLFNSDFTFKNLSTTGTLDVAENATFAKAVTFATIDVGNVASTGTVSAVNLSASGAVAANNIGSFSATDMRITSAAGHNVYINNDKGLAIGNVIINDNSTASNVIINSGSLTLGNGSFVVSNGNIQVTAGNLTDANGTLFTEFIIDNGTGMSIATTGASDLFLNNNKTGGDVVLNNGSTGSNVNVATGNVSVAAGNLNVQLGAIQQGGVSIATIYCPFEGLSQQMVANLSLSDALVCATTSVVFTNGATADATLSLSALTAKVTGCIIYIFNYSATHTLTVSTGGPNFKGQVNTPTFDVATGGNNHAVISYQSGSWSLINNSALP